MRSVRAFWCRVTTNSIRYVPRCGYRVRKAGVARMLTAAKCDSCPYSPTSSTAVYSPPDTMAVEQNEGHGWLVGRTRDRDTGTAGEGQSKMRVSAVARADQTGGAGPAGVGSGVSADFVLVCTALSRRHRRDLGWCPSLDWLLLF